MRRGLRRHWMLGQLRRAGAFGRRGLAAAVMAVVLAAAGAGCAASGSGTSGHTPASGGTVTYALPANNTPNYIFPFMPSQYFTQVNTGNLQYLMYRPLYWFGAKGLPYLNQGRSLAEPPSYNGHVVTIRLKPDYQWSNGYPVTAQDVLFWMNMMKAVVRHSSSTVNWGGYVPGEFPDNVTNIRAVGTDIVKMTIIGPYSEQWFTYNELSQITPMPQAWDTTGPGRASDCTHKVRDCLAVFKYLDALSKNTTTWTQSRLWHIVDGPWELTSLDSQGLLTFRYNRRYSGLVPRHHITVFKELPFTSEEAEYNVLAAGGRSGLDVGYLPTVNAPVPPPGSTVGQNPVAGYRLQPLYTWGLSYFPYNFGRADPQLPVISQQYFRHAMQLLENQAVIIQGPLHGYGHVTAGPVVPGGKSTCQRAGTGTTQCGKGVRQGAQLNFTLYYATGQAWLESALLQLKSSASQLGIDITLYARTFNQVQAEIGGAGCPAAGCPWEMADWGLGWSYVPDYLPTGDELFQTNSFGNVGKYSNPANDARIKQTLASSDMHLMWNWENYLTKQLPVVFQPDAPAALVESINNLYIGTQSPTLAINPEDWYYLR